MPDNSHPLSDLTPNGLQEEQAFSNPLTALLNSALARPRHWEPSYGPGPSRSIVLSGEGGKPTARMLINGRVVSEFKGPQSWVEVLAKAVEERFGPTDR